MGAPAVAMRCPTCGGELRAVLAPSPPTQWFPCPHCRAPVPVVVPRDLPPLYSWEVVPGLYPALPVPRRPRWRPSGIAAGALVLAALVCAASAGALAFDGWLAAQPATYVVSGTVYSEVGGFYHPLRGATVTLYSDGNRSFAAELTGTDGAFRFAGVPNGGIELNVTAFGYAPGVLWTFASRAYSAPLSGLNVTLGPAASNNSSSVALAPFPDLESLLAYVGGGAVLLGGAAFLAAAASVAVLRPEGRVLGVIGSSAALAAPAVVLLLGLGGPFPLVTAFAGGAGAAGAFALVLATAELALRGNGRPSG